MNSENFFFPNNKKSEGGQLLMLTQKLSEVIFWSQDGFAVPTILASLEAGRREKSRKDGQL